MAHSQPSADGQVVGGLALSEPDSEVRQPPRDWGAFFACWGRA